MLKSVLGFVMIVAVTLLSLRIVDVAERHIGPSRAPVAAEAS